MISVTTKGFWRCFDSLPGEVRRQAVRTYVRWHRDQRQPSLHFKCVSGKYAVWSVRIGIHWRAVGYRERVEDEETITWFWIGSHADYDRLLTSM